MYLFDVKVIKRHRDWKRIILAGFLGSVYAYNRADTYHYVEDEEYHESFGKDVVAQFDQRYVTNVLNHTGFGSNYVGASDYSPTFNKKPY
jgi:hypothetical protein